MGSDMADPALEKKKIIELLVPCYNEEQCILIFQEEVTRVFKEMMPAYDYRIFYIDDGSKDKTLSLIRQVADNDPEHVRYVSFSRNFGKESALFVGFSKSIGDYVVPIDADLQHPPTLLPKMAQALEEGHDCAAARRVSRKGEPKIRSAFSRAFYHVINRLTSVEMQPGSTDFRMMKRPVVEALVSMSERERFTKGMYSWVGFDTEWIEYENVERAAGETKWSFSGLVKYAFNGIFAFAPTPLRSVIYLGMFVVFCSVLWGIQIFIKAARQPYEERTGYASIMLAVFLMGGIVIIILGVIGEYLAQIYQEVKRRPIYIVKETNIEDTTPDRLI